MRLRFIPALFLIACTSAPSKTPEVSRQTLTDIWVSSPTIVPKGNAPQRPLFDGTTFWVTSSMQYGDRLDPSDVLRRLDSNGAFIDDGGVRIAARGTKLIRVGGVMMALSMADAGVDAGTALISQRLDATGQLGPPVVVYPFRGLVAGDADNWFAASRDSDSKVLVRENGTFGGHLVSELSVGSNGALESLEPVWPTTTTALRDLHYDGTRYIALVSEPDGGMALQGLLPSVLGRFYRPVAGENSNYATLGGDAVLGAVMTASRVQLLVDAAPTGTVVPFNDPAGAYRDGSDLVIFSQTSSGAFRPITAMRVAGDGGVGAPVEIEPVYSGPIFYYSVVGLISPVAVSGSIALAPFERNEGGISSKVSVIKLGTMAVTPSRALAPLPARVTPSSSLSTLGSPLSLWLGEVREDNVGSVFVQPLSGSGAIGSPTFVDYGRTSFDSYLPSSMAAAQLGDEWLVVTVPSFFVQARRVARDGTLPNSIVSLNDNSAIFQAGSVASGAGIYLVVASRLNALSGFRVNPAGDRIGSELTLSTGAYAEETKTAFDGTNFQVLSRTSSAVLKWVSVTPSGAVTGGPDLSPSARLMAEQSSSGYAVAAWANASTGQVLRLTLGGPPIQLASFDATGATSLAVIETAHGTHVATGSSNGIGWFDVWPDGGTRSSVLFAGQSENFVTLQPVDGGVVMLRTASPSGDRVSADFLQFKPSGSSCVDDLDCLDFRCFAGICCLTCMAVDAGVVDAGVVEVDAGVDSGVLEVDAGFIEVDAGVVEADAGIDQLDAGVTVTRPLSVGCSCDSATGGAAWFAMMTLLVRRRRRLQVE